MADIVWEALLDNKWKCVVTRKSDYLGTLTVSNDDNIVLNEDVPLAYGARFGPDFEDVTIWENRIIDVIDGLSE